MKEAEEGGWGIAVRHFGREEFTALAAAARKMSSHVQADTRLLDTILHAMPRD